MLKKDVWLSSYFAPKEVYNYQPDMEQYDNLPSGFIYAKVQSDSYPALNHLIQKGFYIVETSLLFKQTGPSPFLADNSEFIIRDTCEADRKQVTEIASTIFKNDRFYKDPNISDNLSSTIKREWANNYYNGMRGTQMLVCESNKKTILGFLLLNNSTIDLIATTQTYSKKGVASSLIAFANKKFGALQAGTQSTNYGAVNLYKKNNFSLVETKFTLHRHQ